MIEALLRARGRTTATMDIANGDVRSSPVDARTRGERREQREEESIREMDVRPGGARSRRRKRGEEGGPGEEARTIPLEDRLGVGIKSRPELYDRVLLMETVDVDDLLEALAEDARTGAGLGGRFRGRSCWRTSRARGWRCSRRGAEEEKCRGEVSTMETEGVVGLGERSRSRVALPHGSHLLALLTYTKVLHYFEGGLSC